VTTTTSARELYFASSFGWGHNSQWKTDFRRDYLTADSYQFNVDAETDINEAGEFGDKRLTLLHGAPCGTRAGL
jgi:hypothetical protein